MPIKLTSRNLYICGTIMSDIITGFANTIREIYACLDSNPKLKGKLLNIINEHSLREELKQPVNIT